MMTATVGRAGTRERAVAATISAVLQAALIAALVAGLAVSSSRPVDEAIKAFDLVPPPATPPPAMLPPKRPVHAHEQGASSPPNLRAKATEIVAPPPPIILPPPPVVVAPQAATGSASHLGAADIAGPGTGSGGQGTGPGSGDGGTGDGDGRGPETPPHRLRGRLKDSDYPRVAAEAGAGGTVSVRYVVAPNGRVTDCVVTRSSGSAELDDTTCRLIMDRFRFDPSRDAAGRPVESIVAENHNWGIEQLPPERR